MTILQNKPNFEGFGVSIMYYLADLRSFETFKHLVKFIQNSINELANSFWFNDSDSIFIPLFNFQYFRLDCQPATSIKKQD